MTTTPIEQRRYGLRRRLDLPFEEAIHRTREALKSQGFGVLTEIDVTATLREKLGVEFGSYVILGACNPPLAFRALTAEPEVGLLLPCNVVVRADEGGTVVEAMDPVAAMSMVENELVHEVAGEARRRLSAALDALVTN